MGYDAQVIRSKRAEGLQIFLRSISIYDLLIPLRIAPMINDTGGVKSLRQDS
jgi:hypothetical protein